MNKYNTINNEDKNKIKNFDTEIKIPKIDINYTKKIRVYAHSIGSYYIREEIYSMLKTVSRIVAIRNSYVKEKIGLIN